MTPSRLKLWTALLTLYVVWGSTYLGIKLAVRTLPPLLAGGVRFLVAGAVLAAGLALLGRSLRVTGRQAVSALAIGALMLAGGVGGVHVAETRIDSGVAALIAGSVPLQVVVLRSLVGDRVARSTRLAAVAGLAGLALVVAPGATAGSSTAVGLLVMLASTMAWTSGSFLSGRVELPRDPFVAAAWEMVGGGLVLVAAGTIAGQWADVDRAALQAGPLAALAYLAVFGSLVGFSAYVWLLRNAPISQVVTHQYVNPLVAVVLGALVLDERLSLVTAVGAAVVLGAVFATVRAEGRRARRARAATPVDSAA